MNTDWLTYLGYTFSAARDVALNASPWHLLFLGLSLPIVAWFIVRAYRNIARVVGAIFRILAHRISQKLGNLKTMFVCRFRHLFPQRKARAHSEAVPQVEFDDLDLAVLKIAATLGPGFAINAPELADRFRMRAPQVQSSLDKLSSNKMLDYVIGSNEGFDNYRLTQLGNNFMSNWARQTAHA